MTQFSPDWPSRVTALRRHTDACDKGGVKSFDHFKSLVSELLCITVGYRQGGIIMSRPEGDLPERRQISGRDGPKKDLVRLNGGGYLKLVMALYLKADGSDNYMRASVTNYQYQLDEAGADWVFRYEYARNREPGDVRPMGHLHVRATPKVSCLPSKETLERVHFACGRPTLEGVIAVLADEFHVPTNASEDIWRSALRDTEAAFMCHAHAALI